MTRVGNTSVSTGAASCFLKKMKTDIISCNFYVILNVKPANDKLPVFSACFVIFARDVIITIIINNIIIIILYAVAHCLTTRLYARASVELQQ